jgi:hypothetical protein
VGEEGWDVARTQDFALSESEHERAIGLGHDDLVRYAARQYRDGIGPAHAGQSDSYGQGEGRSARGECFVDQIGHDLRVGITREARATLFNLPPERDMVFDDPVVDYRHAPRDMGMRVRLARATVGGPARVSDARRPR